MAGLTASVQAQAFAARRPRYNGMVHFTSLANSRRRMLRRTCSATSDLLKHAVSYASYLHRIKTAVGEGPVTSERSQRAWRAQALELRPACLLADSSRLGRRRRRCKEGVPAVGRRPHKRHRWRRLRQRLRGGRGVFCVVAVGVAVGIVALGTRIVFAHAL